MNHHQTLPPSAFPAFLQCACYKPGGGPGRDADLGTKMHAYSEGILLGKCDAGPGELDAMQAEACEWAAGELRAALESNAPGAVVTLERRMDLIDDQMNLITFGHADVVAVPATGAPVVADLKSGLDWDPMAHYHEPQLAVYALSIMRETKEEKCLCLEVYIMPRKVKVYWLTYQEAAAMVAAVIARIDDRKKVPQPCDHCRFCSGLLVCPAVNKKIAVIEKVFSDIAEEAFLAPESITDPSEMAAALTWAKQVLKKYAKRVEAVAERIEAAALLMSEKIDLPNYKRVVGRKKEITDVEAAYNLSGLEPKEFFRAVKVSIPKLSAVYSDKNGLKATAGRKALEGLLHEVISTEDGSISLERCDE